MPTSLIYIRRSVNKTGEATVSPEKQAEACIAVCEQHGWTYETYKDLEGWRSGRFESTRPAWLQLKERVAKGNVAAVVVYRLDRASRSPKDFFNFLGLLQDKHVDLVSATQDLDSSTPYGRMFVGLLSLWAALEAEITSERVRETVVWKQTHGIHVGDVPLGYNREKRTITLGSETVTTSVLVVNPDEAKIIETVYDAYASNKHSYRSLAEHLNLLGYRTKNKGDKPNPFTGKAVQVILGNHWLYRGYVVRNEGQEDEEIVRGVHEAIVDDEVVQKALQNAAAWHSRLPRGPHQRRTFILPNLHCAICGAEMRGITERRNGKAIYRHASVKGTCPVQQSGANELERSFLDLFDGLEFSDEELNLIERQWSLIDAPSGDDTQKRLAYLEQRLSRAKRLYMAGDLSEKEWQAEKRTIEQQKADLAPHSRADGLRRVAEVVRNLGRAIQTANPERQKILIDSICERLETNGESITRIVPRHWFKDFFHDLSLLQGRVKGYPQGTPSAGLDALVYLFAEHPVGVPASAAPNRPKADRNAAMRSLRETMTLAELSERYGISVARVWEICRRA